MAVSKPSAEPFLRGRLGQGGVAWQSGGVGDRPGQVGDLAGVVGGVAGDVDGAVGEERGQVVDHLQAQVGAGGGGLAAPQPGGHRQRHRLGEEGQADHDGGDHPGVAEPELVLAPAGTVVGPQCSEDLLADAVEQGVVDDDQDRRVRRQQGLDDRAGQAQAELVGIPGRLGEEGMRPAVRPQP